MERRFFERDGDVFRPTDRARGPWGHDTMHGRVVAGLVARTLEREQGDDAFLFARLTVDLFRMPTMDPLSVTTESIREGRRIRISHARVTCNGKEIARAYGVQLRASEAPPGAIWRPEPWDVPSPSELEPMPGRGDWEPMWETRPIDGSEFIGVDQKRMWIKETHALVAGEEVSPFVRVAGASDIASPLAMSGEQGLQFVNADISLYLHRLPVTAWTGWEVVDHGSAAGIGRGECRIYDEKGPIGTSTVCAVANPRLES